MGLDGEVVGASEVWADVEVEGEADDEEVNCVMAHVQKLPRVATQVPTAVPVSALPTPKVPLTGAAGACVLEMHTARLTAALHTVLAAVAQHGGEAGGGASSGQEQETGLPRQLEKLRPTASRLVTLHSSPVPDGDTVGVAEGAEG